MDLSKYTFDELQWLKKDIDKELTSRRKLDAKKAQQELKSVAERYGFTLNELISGQTAKLTLANTAVRFRHPEDADKIWSGRGRKPAWIKEWEARGHSLDELRVE
ncbi:MAG: H-NS histone family protein [Nitrococcus mobilis]|nr:H-NS histone family protein [Nitrococcus mobilis]